MKAKTREALQNAALMLASTVLGLLLLEGGLRLATGDRYLDVDLRLRHGDLLYEPDQAMRWKRIEWDVEYKINSRGFRDYEYDQPAPRSVVALGDSFTEGYGVDLEQSWGRRLAAALEEAGKPWRVYISGIQGRQPEHYYAMYDRVWSKEPGVKLVVLGFCIGTDIESGPSSPVVQAPPMSWSYYVKRWLCEHSVLYNFVRRPARLSPWVSGVLARLKLNRPVAPLDLPWISEAHRPKWEFTLDRLTAFDRKLKKDGRALAILLIPNKEAVEPDTLKGMLDAAGVSPDQVDVDAFARYARRRAENDGLQLLDLRPAFVAANEKEPGAFYFKTDGHWTARGHELAAREALKFLRQRRLPPF